jgi:signal transduction histidine kinase
MVLGGLALAAGLLLPSPDARALAYQVIAAVGLAALAVGIVLHRPPRRAGWWLLVAGMCWFYLGDLLFSLYTRVFDVSATGSLADVCYLAGYPFVLAGLAMVVRQGRDQDGRSLAAWLDVGILTTGLCLLAWMLLIVPAFGASPAPLLTKLLAIAYPLADVPVLAVLVRMLLGRGHRTQSSWLLLLSLAVMTSADVVYGVGGLDPASTLATDGAVRVADGLYLVFWFLLGAAGLHSSMAGLSRPGRRRQGGLTLPRLAALAIAALAGPIALLVEATRVWDLGVFLAATGSLGLGLLVLVRAAGLVRVGQSVQVERRRLLERLIGVSEDERTRVALEIHDGPLQVLAQVNFELERGQRLLARGDADRGMAVLAVAQARLREEIQGLRQLMVSLRPPALDEVGLDPALRDWLAQLQRRSGIRCELRADIERLDRPLETTIYRVVQETLTEATRVIGEAAGASVVVVLAGRGDWVELEVRTDGLERTGPAGDDAVASAVAASGIWLAGVRERIELAGGTWTGGDDPDEGPRVAARFQRTGPSLVEEAAAAAGHLWLPEAGAEPEAAASGRRAGSW